MKKHIWTVEFGKGHNKVTISATSRDKARKVCKKLKGLNEKGKIVKYKQVAPNKNHIWGVNIVDKKGNQSVLTTLTRREARIMKNNAKAQKAWKKAECQVKINKYMKEIS